jgi:hypothetical protein
MKSLKPLFKLDTRTQRGFMACVHWSHLEIAMREENILLEVKLATLQYYFEIASNNNQVMIECYRLWYNKWCMY